MEVCLSKNSRISLCLRPLHRLKAALRAQVQRTFGIKMRIADPPEISLDGHPLDPVRCRLMSKPVQAPSGADAAGSELAFEEAVKRLESIVQSMESEDLPLETLLSRYEEGTRIARLCQKKLGQAEVRIQELEKNSSGQAVIKPVSTHEA